jgi:hypothetical protein
MPAASVVGWNDAFTAAGKIAALGAVDYQVKASSGERQAT